MDNVLLVVVVLVALGFDFTNGFHDTANAVAFCPYGRWPLAQARVPDGPLALVTAPLAQDATAEAEWTGQRTQHGTRCPPS